ncbi:hypothetical protein C1645_820170 [Glomus cerebriforme]|uniref:Uncharacterized protein n=1 Tax=Glomus cerebriforme TaxID=658196 RepID=A0A397T8T1_9GLOM|nr:hypothetical protein C1645_820170 [Glomus cerebriforme]
MAEVNCKYLPENADKVASDDSSNEKEVDDTNEKKEYSSNERKKEKDDDVEDEVDSDLEKIKVQIIIRSKNIKDPIAKTLSISKNYIISYKAVNVCEPSNKLEDELDFQEFIINKETTYKVPPSYLTFDVKSSISVNRNNLTIQAQVISPNTLPLIGEFLNSLDHKHNCDVYSNFENAFREKKITVNIIKNLSDEQL